MRKMSKSTPDVIKFVMTLKNLHFKPLMVLEAPPPKKERSYTATNTNKSISDFLISLHMH